MERIYGHSIQKGARILSVVSKRDKTDTERSLTKGSQTRFSFPYRCGGQAMDRGGRGTGEEGQETTGVEIEKVNMDGAT